MRKVSGDCPVIAGVVHLFPPEGITGRPIANEGREGMSSQRKLRLPPFVVTLVSSSLNKEQTGGDKISCSEMAIKYSFKIIAFSSCNTTTLPNQRLDLSAEISWPALWKSFR